ncbi:FAD-binding protein [Kocuria sp. JC486]|uniref:FAD-binding oxidoreductase n=1 Tax=Kocuria sp. JC486 TaxID=1970736 RepID=UPI0014223510|nr:FAD-linked oxidase C-terminal domain-containing protein [Kocuria sp. JC486]NHU86081.1 FAD-binding protein [Kocuria sp. JC486]
MPTTEFDHSQPTDALLDQDQSAATLPGHLQTASDEAIEELVRELGDAVSTDAAVLEEHSRDTSRAEPGGLPAAVVRVHSATEVQTVLRWATTHRVPVSVRGAGTGVSGGALAYPGGLVVSLAAMNQVLEIDAPNRIAEVDPGIIVDQLDQAAAAHELMYAPDPVSYQTATIGGTVATNAGGLRCLAHGVTRDVIAGLEVVLADGRLIRTGSRTRKNSTGYDLTGLFIGSEGTLGVVTRVIARLKPRPVGEAVTFSAQFPTMAAAGAAVATIMASATTPEMLELMDRNSIDIVQRHFPSAVAAEGEALLVGQTIGTDAQQQAEAVVSACRDAGALLAEAGGGEELLDTRRMVNPALNAAGLALSCDVAVPPSRLAEMFERIDDISVQTGYPVNTCAHAGDGNMHPSVLAANDSAEEVAAAEHVLTLITEAALDMGGVISGEHRIGSLKTGMLAQQFDPDTLDLQHQLKGFFDPVGILSPGRAI